MGNTRDFKENSEESLAMELLKDFKKQNKRQFVIILVLLLMFTCLLGYTIWLLNDIGTTTDTIDIDDVDDIDFYIVINSLVNDYGKVIDKGDTNTYAKMARSFILDEDAKKNKVWRYFTKIVK